MGPILSGMPSSGSDQELRGIPVPKGGEAVVEIEGGVGEGEGRGRGRRGCGSPSAGARAVVIILYK